jgi:divinyl protochlorophyllide a 8-vinyl-reductase
LRLEEPELAPALAAHAGTATADYILANRIPRPAQIVLKASPPAFAARTLAKAIARHAWTFAGSGAFTVVDPMTFEVTDNPLIAGERSDVCLCHWHSAVFERLYQTLVAPDVTCHEATCHAQDPELSCRFVLRRNKTAARLTDIKSSSAAAQ